MMLTILLHFKRCFTTLNTTTAISWVTGRILTEFVETLAARVLKSFLSWICQTRGNSGESGQIEWKLSLSLW